MEGGETHSGREKVGPRKNTKIRQAGYVMDRRDWAVQVSNPGALQCSSGALHHEYDFISSNRLHLSAFVTV